VVFARPEPEDEDEDGGEEEEDVPSWQIRPSARVLIDADTGIAEIRGVDHFCQIALASVPSCAMDKQEEVLVRMCTDPKNLSDMVCCDVVIDIPTYLLMQPVSAIRGIITKQDAIGGFTENKHDLEDGRYKILKQYAGGSGRVLRPKQEGVIKLCDVLHIDKDADPPMKILILHMPSGGAGNHVAEIQEIRVSFSTDHPDWHRTGPETVISVPATSTKCNLFHQLQGGRGSKGRENFNIGELDFDVIDCQQKRIALPPSMTLLECCEVNNISTVSHTFHCISCGGHVMLILHMCAT
jgi:hypothetical protein